MPDISGSGNANVTDDVGTLNGAPQGGPIDNIDMNGDDVVTVINSTISGTIDTGSSDDSITIIDSTVGGTIDSGNSSDTVSIFGSNVGDVRLGSSNDVLNIGDSIVTGIIDAGSGNNALNLPAGTIVHDDSEGTFTVVTGVPYTITDGSFTLPTGQTSSYESFDEGIGIVCFARGTQIATPDGEVPVEDLNVGDTVSVYGGGQKKIRWLGRRHINKSLLVKRQELRPVRIMAGALANGLPTKDLLVSRQHRMLIRSKIAKRMFGIDEVLISAIKLTQLPGVSVATDVEDVQYFHIFLDQHDLIIANGAPSESLLAGCQALEALGAEARQELEALFPELAEPMYKPTPKRHIPENKQQKKLVERHLKNKKPLLIDVPSA